MQHVTDLTHLNALELRLSHERLRLSAAKREPERALRAVWIAQIEKEIANEKAFLGIDNTANNEMSDEELLKALEI